MRAYRVALAIGLTLVATQSGGQTTEQVALERVECVRLNADGYLAQDTDPVIILLENCPDPVLTPEEMLVALSNSGSLPQPDKGTGVNVLILRKSQITCLRDRDIVMTVADRPDQVRLDFGRCGP